MLEERDEINNALGKQFSPIGVDSTLESDYKERILNFMKEKDELARKDENGITSISDIAVNISTSERIIISLPNFRKSLGISSIPGALPNFSFISVFEMDSFVNKIDSVFSSFRANSSFSFIKFKMRSL
jgi:hypothetical protein